MSKESVYRDARCLLLCSYNFETAVTRYRFEITLDTLNMRCEVHLLQDH